MNEITSIQAQRFWAIRLINTDFQTWEDNFSRVLFDWTEIGISAKASREDVIINVTKHLPEQSRAEIKNIAEGIKNYSGIEVGDGILGINKENKIEKMGLVTSNSYNQYKNPNQTFEVNLSIQWKLELETSIRQIAFKPNQIIKKLSDYAISSLSIPIETAWEDKIKSSGPTYHLIEEEPISYKFLSDELQTDGIGRVSLFYGTTRSKAGLIKNKQSYNYELSELTYGQCEVTIPRNHQQGEIERPSFLKFEFSENPEKHVVIEKASSIDYSGFIAGLKTDLSKLEKKSALIFIDGYNNSFEDVAMRTAQIAWDIPFKGVCGFFSWPSASKTKAYLSDIEKADASVPAFEKFVKDIILDSGLEQLHIIAHSMGNRILTAGLNNLSSDSSFNKISDKIRQIVLAAPDIDQSVFKNSLLPKFQKIGNGRTIYSSERDKALAASEFFRGAPRLGDAGKSLFVCNGLDTIDSSEIRKGLMNHSYAFDTKELLTDLYYLLNQELRPIHRRLRAKMLNKLKYWLFLS